MLGYREGEDGSKDLKAAGYRPGHVTRVHMKNFLTYDLATVFPGPRLNVILGPNGTGKSTITHAMCLACGGAPATVGRAPDLKQFVKIGKEGCESFCEVDILDKNYEKVQIRRTITDKSGKSVWTMRGQTCTQKDVKSLMNDLSIDVDNLCSFMAQDKVGKFTTQSPKEILETTFRSIKISNDSDRTLYDQMIEVTDFEKNKFERELELRLTETALADLKTQVEGMRGEVNRIQQRQENLLKLEYYKVKNAIVHARDITEYKKKKQDLLDEATAKLNDAEAKVQPLKNKLRDIQRKFLLQERAQKVVAETAKKAEKDISNVHAKVERQSQEMESSLEELQNYLTMRRNAEVKVEKQRLEVEKALSRQEKLLAAKPQLEADILDFNRRLNELQSLEQQYQDEQDHLQKRRSDLDRDLRDKTLAYGQLTDSRQVFQSNLQKCDFSKKQSYGDLIMRGMHWVEQHKAEFTDDVFGPIAMHIKVADFQCAAMVILSVSPYKLMTFLTKNAHDETLLRNANLGIDVALVDQVKPHSGPYPRALLDSLRDEVGLQGYLIDQVQAPPPVKTFLSDFCGLGLPLWARGVNISSKFGETQFKKLLEVFDSIKLYAENLSSERTRGEIIIYESMRSRYGNKSIQSSRKNAEEWQMRDKILIAGVESDTDIIARRTELSSTMAFLQTSISQVDEEKRRVRDKQSGNHSDTKSLREQRQTRAGAITEANGAAQKVKQEERKLEEFSRAIQVDAATERKEIEGKYRNTFVKLTDHLSVHVKAIRTGKEACLDKAVADIALKKIKGDESKVVEDIREAENEFVALKQSKEEAKKALDIAVGKYNSAEADLNIIKAKFASDRQFVEFYASKVLPSCPEDTIDDINARIVALNVAIDTCIDNPELLKRFCALEKDLVEKTGRRDRMKEDFDKVDAVFSGQKEEWQNKATAISNRLSTHFEKFMKELQFDGSVQMRQSGTETDGTNIWQMEIKVKFREQDDLLELSGTRNSGGERAVSTIMYLMALQELASSPFRVVDEINQGMDERNERLVFDRIVSSCCSEALNDFGIDSSSKPSRSQYFLVSPKLLQGLNAMDNPNVTVLMVYNGPGVIDTNWQLPSVLSLLRKRKDRLSQLLGFNGSADSQEDERTETVTNSNLDECTNEYENYDGNRINSTHGGGGGGGGAAGVNLEKKAKRA